MCLSTTVWSHLCPRLCVCICLSVSALCMEGSSCVSVHKLIYVYVCAIACLRLRFFVCLYVCVWMCVFLCVRLCLRVSLYNWDCMCDCVCALYVSFCTLYFYGLSVCVSETVYDCPSVRRSVCVCLSAGLSESYWRSMFVCV